MLTNAAVLAEISRLGSIYADWLRARGIDPVNDRASTLLDEACDALQEQAHADADSPSHGGSGAAAVSAWHQFGDPDRPSRSCDWRGVNIERGWE